MGKRFRRLLSLLMAVVMTMGLSVTTFAADSYTITINSEKSGHTYEAYQIFSGTLYDASGYVATSDPENETGKLYIYDTSSATYVEATYDSTSGETYYIYNDADLVLSDIAWGSGVDGTALLGALQADTTLGTIFANCSTAKDVAVALSAYKDDSDVAKAFAQLASENLTSTVAGTSTESTSPYTIAGLDAGYYLVKDKDNTVTAEGDAYTDIILEVVSDVNVTAKAEYTTVEKDVDISDTYITGTVSYTLTGTLPDISDYSTYQYDFHDTLSKGLTITNTGTDTNPVYDVTVTVYDKDATTGTEVANGYTLTVGSYDATNGTSIQVTIADVNKLYAKDATDPISVGKGTTIVVTYTASLNSNAVVGGDGNKNEVYVEYSNNPNGSGTGKTTTDDVLTWTFELDVTKVDGTDTTKTLEGAEFALYYIDSNNTKQYVTINSLDKVTGWTEYLTKQDGDPTDRVYASALTSDSSGNFVISGLDAGTYYMKETKAPDGYNLSDDVITIVITPTYEDTDSDGNDNSLTNLTATAQVGTGTVKDLSADKDTGKISVTVTNTAGSTLPSTGGIGTTIFYVIGGILVAGAAVLLITKKRLGKME
ncbi:MAG: isopeptide-forming domain-containing fimbrial protein [Clostridiales bacterium]|nr:isopeptide-forming domain-containing fimbrial protein [Clostridiales bacterium]